MTTIFFVQGDDIAVDRAGQRRRAAATSGDGGGGSRLLMVLVFNAQTIERSDTKDTGFTSNDGSSLDSRLNAPQKQFIDDRRRPMGTRRVVKLMKSPLMPRT